MTILSAAFSKECSAQSLPFEKSKKIHKLALYLWYNNHKWLLYGSRRVCHATALLLLRRGGGSAPPVGFLQCYCILHTLPIVFLCSAGQQGFIYDIARGAMMTY
ncbi:MAG: hypothetical protein RSE10_06370, partial [Oscillospiraceae bacterium]